MALTMQRGKLSPGCSWHNEQNGMAMISALYGICTAGAAFALFVFSVVPPLQTEHLGIINSGVWVHMLAYGMLCGFASLWLANRMVRRPVPCAVFLCMLFGIMIECVQSAFPYRSFETVDIFINCCAVLAVAVPLHFYVRRAFPVKEDAGKVGTNCRLQ